MCWLRLADQRKWSLKLDSGSVWISYVVTVYALSRHSMCKCGYPQSAQILGQLPPIRSESDHFRRSIYSAPPKFLPELFLYIMDTPDSSLVSVPALSPPATLRGVFFVGRA